MKKLLSLAFALSLLGSPAFAQVVQLTAGQVLGNSTASQGLAKPASMSAMLDRAFSSTQGTILYRGSSSWQALATGTASSALLTLGAGANPVWGAVGLAGGGTNASLTASNGGIFYSTASAGAILSGTATARQMLQSGSSAAPAWSTTTWPATSTINRILYSSSANVIGEIASANSGILNTDGTGGPSITPTPTLGVNGGTGGQVTLNGSSSGSGVIKVAAAAGAAIVFQIPSSNGSNTNVLQTDGAGVTSWAAAGAGTVTTITQGFGINLSTSPCTSTCTISVPLIASSSHTLNGGV